MKIKGKKNFFCFYGFLFSFEYNFSSKDPKKLVKPFPNKPWILHVYSRSRFENTVGKGEIVRNKQAFPFPAAFCICLENFLPFSGHLKLSSANFISLEVSKLYRLGMG